MHIYILYTLEIGQTPQTYVWYLLLYTFIYDTSIYHMDHKIPVIFVCFLLHTMILLTSIIWVLSRKQPVEDVVVTLNTRHLVCHTRLLKQI